MRRTKSTSDGDTGAFLVGTHSELADFGESGADGFASAWDARTAGHDTGTHDDLFSGFEDKTSQRARDLDRRSRKGVVLLVLVIVAGLGLAAAIRAGFFGEADDASTAPEDRPNELAAIGDDRVYVEGPAGVSITNSGLIDQWFISDSNSSGPTPTDAMPDMDVEAAFGTVFWAGRTHVAVVTRGLDLSVDCVIASLVTADLRVIDVASQGACSSQFDETGDRRACVGDEVVLLEVWPYDPDSVVERPAVEGLRVRIERRTEPAGPIVSLRGSATVDDDLATGAAALFGAPGTTTTIGIADLSSSCELLDRAGVPVQLL